MPTYEYKCRDCGRGFEKKIGIQQHERGGKPRCPKCGSRKVEQRPAAFAAVTSHKG
ncbi:MAG: FmdB family zinc ribbon protein [Bacillota bacterium]